MEHWRVRAEKLDARERALKQAMNPDVRQVMASKRLLLFGEMLREVNFPEADKLVGLMSAGFPLGGTLPETGVFPCARRQAEHSIEDLWRSAPHVRAQLFASVSAGKDPQLDEYFYDQTLEEVG